MDFGVKLAPDLEKTYQLSKKQIKVLYGFICPRDLIHNFYMLGVFFSKLDFIFPSLVI